MEKIDAELQQSNNRTSARSRNGANIRSRITRRTVLRWLIATVVLIYVLYSNQEKVLPSLTFIAGCLSYRNGCFISRPPNIVFILTDDQVSS